MRVIRRALSTLRLDQNLLRHRIYREVFGMPLATNWREFLLGQAERLQDDLPSVAEITEAAKERWILPRAARLPGYESWDDADLEEMFASFLA
jgi:hypothetical protein